MRFSTQQNKGTEDKSIVDKRMRGMDEVNEIGNGV
jgi:hypothetical protein